MSDKQPTTGRPHPLKAILLAISLDWWAVIIGLTLAALILLGIISSVPW